MKLTQDQFLAAVLAASDLLDAHKVCSAIPPSKRTQMENDLAQLGLECLKRIAQQEGDQ